MARHLLRAATALSGTKGPALGQPGSNGYWRREIFSRPGTYQWTAKKAGKVKFQALGTGSGNCGQYPGASGGFGEKEVTVAAGDTYTIVVGDGGAGANNQAGAAAGSGTTTSISGPALSSALVLPGATGTKFASGTSTLQTLGQAGTPSGPWDKTAVGANALAIAGAGGPSSGSPLGPGWNTVARGGCGWGGPSLGDGGASTHVPGSLGQGTQSSGASGLTTIPAGDSVSGAPANPQPVSDVTTRPFWDLADADSAGPGIRIAVSGSGSTGALSAGPGAGGSYGTQGPGASALGGGSSYCSGSYPLSAAPGAGAAGANSNPAKGGTGFVLVFFDEVA